jgi:hypothetical protein
VKFLHLCNLGETFISFRKALLFGDVSEILVERRPFKLLAVSRCLQIGCCIANGSCRVSSDNFRFSSFEQTEEKLSMFFLIVGCFEKNSSYLFIALLSGRARKKGIAIPGLRFTRKRS